MPIPHGTSLRRLIGCPALTYRFRFGLRQCVAQRTGFCSGILTCAPPLDNHLASRDIVRTLRPAGPPPWGVDTYLRERLVSVLFLTHNPGRYLDLLPRAIDAPQFRR